MKVSYINSAIKLLLLISTFYFAVNAQSIEIVKDNNLVNEIIKAYNEFDYQKSSYLLETALRNIDNFSENEKILIYQYAAFLAFQNNKNNQTAQYFWQILEINPSFSLDTITTPPKILTIFQKTKIEFLEELNRRSIQSQENNPQLPFPWRSFFPGWEHWHRGHHLKGAMWGTLATFTLSGTLISVIQTQQREKEYIQAKDQNKIESLYNEYRSAYRRQYYFGYAFCAILALSQIDLALFTRQKTVLHPSITLKTYQYAFPEVSVTILLP